MLSPLFGFALAVELCIAVLGTALAGINTKGTPLTAGYGSPEQIGQSFLTRYLLAFELASLLLLVAAVGAVVLARRRRGLDDAVDEPLRVIRRPAFTGTMAEWGVCPSDTSRRRARSRSSCRPGSVPRLGPRVTAVPGGRAGRRRVVNIAWYLVVSVIIFCIGAGGVLVRPNPMVILLCLELMLNAGNLALVAFARMWGGDDGQIFALIVLVVAACEVTVGLGLIVALYRRQLPVDVDELSELRG